MATWKITDMNIVSDDGRNLVDFVHTMRFTCTEEVDGNFGVVESSVVLSMADATNFTDIQDVTEEQAMAWLFNALGPENKEYVEAEALIKAAPKVNPNKPSWLETV